MIFYLFNNRVNTNKYHDHDKMNKTKIIRSIKHYIKHTPATDDHLHVIILPMSYNVNIILGIFTITDTVMQVKI